MFGVGTGHALEILHQCGKSVKAKSRKDLGLIPTFVEITGEKLLGSLFVSPYILNRVKTRINFTKYLQILHSVY